MPANLTPQYQRIELAYRRAQTTAERLTCLESMLALIPKHKGTEKLQAELKTRLKEARAELQQEQRSPKTARSVRIPRQGAARVVIVGGPNSGKSRIVRELTHAEPLVADYPFATREPLPGMMDWEDTAIQLVDLPPITAGSLEPGLLNLIRTADLVLLTWDSLSEDSIEDAVLVVRELSERHTTLSDHGGIDPDDFARVHVKTLPVATRWSGHEKASPNLPVVRTPLLPAVGVELADQSSCDRLRERIARSLDFVRVYTRAPGQQHADPSPVILEAGATVEDLARKLHEDLAKRVRSARVWSSDLATPQVLGKDTVLHDQWTVELLT